MSRTEIRDLLMDAGRSILAEEGLGVGASRLTFKRAFDRVEATTGVRLTNASVIRRVFENQAEYQEEVLATVAALGDFAGEMGTTAESVAPLLGSLDRSSPEARLRSLSEVARVAGGIAFRSLVESEGWSLWVGVWALGATSGTTPHSDRIRRSLVDGYRLGTRQWGELHLAVAAHLGLRPRRPLTAEQFTVSTGALVEGCALRHVGAGELPVIERPTGPGGSPQEWTLFAVGLEALALQFFEPDPDWTPPDDPD